jgi:hypothetical protein
MYSIVHSLWDCLNSFQQYELFQEQNSKRKWNLKSSIDTSSAPVQDMGLHNEMKKKLV